jgi:hypothetical protein
MDDETKPKPMPPIEAPTAEDLERVRALILDRRNQFIAAALAGLGAATASCTQASPAPTTCLSVVSVGQGGTGTRQGGIQGTAGRPTPCLSIAAIGGRTGAPGLIVPTAGNSAAGSSGAAGQDAQDKQARAAGHGAAGNGHKDEDAGM